MFFLLLIFSFLSIEKKSILVGMCGIAIIERHFDGKLFPFGNSFTHVRQLNLFSTNEVNHFFL